MLWVCIPCTFGWFDKRKCVNFYLFRSHSYVKFGGCKFALSPYLQLLTCKQYTRALFRCVYQISRN